MSDETFAHAVFDRALLRGTFTLRSGATSDRYFDKYRVTCDPALLAPVTAELAALVREHAPDVACIVGPELGAVPLATALSLELGVPALFVRGASKDYGTNRRIEGTVVPGAVAIVIEDVITSGGAAIDTIAVVRKAGLDVTASFCVLDRNSGGREALDELGAPLRSLFDIEDMNAAFDAGRGHAVSGS